MGTQKWHALDHVCDGIKEVGGLSNLHAVFFESAHEQFTQSFCLSLKGSRSVMTKISGKKDTNFYLIKCFCKKPE